MLRAGLIALVVIGAASVAATAAGRDAATPSAARCGGTLWRLKTLSDTGRASVHLTPESTTIAEIAKRPFPRPIPRRRRTPFQRETWQVVAQITDYRLVTGGIRLVLWDAGSYMNAVIPLPDCLSSRTRARNDIAGAWKAFSANCAPGPANGWQPLGAIGYVRGIGFWGQKGLRGSARNGAELHPVTSIRIVAGC